MSRNRASFSVYGVVIAMSLVMAIPARAGNISTSVSNTSGFRTEAANLTTANIAGGIVDSMRSVQGQGTSFAGISSFRVTPGTTLTFYVQSFGAPGMGPISPQDDAIWYWHHKKDPPVSEPASMALFGSGLAVLGGVIRRRRRLKLK
ncbi:MAG: PEP-CTERM sorting domain-containing protein [Candidatus Sulfotelmatobacter sp.]